MTKKITKATFKSFIRKNEDKLMAKVKSSFDGMVDCVMPVNGEWKKAERSDWAERCKDNTLGFQQIWLVGQSRDYFNHYEDDKYIGIEWYNCTGSGIIGIEK